MINFIRYIHLYAGNIIKIFCINLLLYVVFYLVYGFMEESTVRDANNKFYREQTNIMFNSSQCKNFDARHDYSFYIESDKFKYSHLLNNFDMSIYKDSNTDLFEKYDKNSKQYMISKYKLEKITNYSELMNNQNNTRLFLLYAYNNNMKKDYIICYYPDSYSFDSHLKEAVE